MENRMSYLFVNNQEIKNDSGNPIPITGTVTNTGGDIAVSNFPASQTVDGTVALDATSLAALENTTVDINNFPSVQTVDGTMFLDSTNITALQSVTAAISNFPATQNVAGTVTLDATSLAALETINANVTGTVSLDSGSLVSLENVTVNVGSSVEINNDTGNPIPVSGTVALDSDTKAALENTTVNVTFPASQTVDGTVAIDATSLAALETITVDTITNPVTVDTIANPIIVDVINNPVAVTGTFFQATQPISGTVTVQDGGNSITVDGSVSVNNFPTTQSVSLDSSSRDALENITATVTFPASQTVDGTVALDASSLAALETITVDTVTNPVTIQDGGNSITVDGTVSVNQPVAITDNDSSITVDGTVAINNFPSTQTVDGTVALDAASLAALETTTVDTITNPVTIIDGGGTITVDGIMTPYLIGIAQGLVSGTSSINKFGYRESIPSSYQTIWDGTVDYAYAAAGTVLAVADNTGSDNNGTVEVQGLDQNYAPITETLTIGGAASSNQFLRVFRARMITSNTGSTNVDEIRIKRATTDLAIILAGAGQTLMSLYTIPAGKTGYLIRLQGNVDANNDALFRLVSRPLNGSFNVKGQFGVFASGYTADYPIPLVFTEKTDLQITAKSQNNVGGGATFDLILKDN
jgi:hypothetical protein